jgi:ATP-dependent RNA helicase RhlE
MFSATMPQEIAQLAHRILVNPVNLAVTPVSSTVEQITQWVLHVERGDKRALLREVLRDPKMTRVLVFTRTKRGANRVAEELDRNGVRADAIHGNKSQGARQRALESFKRAGIRVLVATDIAARGIDVEGISHATISSSHRTQSASIGRTARGRVGCRPRVLRPRGAFRAARHRTADARLCAWSRITRFSRTSVVVCSTPERGETRGEGERQGAAIGGASGARTAERAVARQSSRAGRRAEERNTWGGGSPMRGPARGPQKPTPTA